MRLWHVELLPYLPQQQLLSQHRECVAMLGKGWGKKHVIVDYVWHYDRQKLIDYHYVVIKEMLGRGINVRYDHSSYRHTGTFYKEHDDWYLVCCLYNLEEKGHDLWWHFPHVVSYRVR